MSQIFSGRVRLITRLLELVSYSLLQGDVYSVGYGEQGQLGLGLGEGTGTTSIPEKIELFDNSRVISVSASVTHNRM